MDSNGILATIAIVISVGGAIVAIINHKQIKSTCCRKEMEISLDINNTQNNT